ncbi:hypothetical protein [Kribbella caucasensis]|nr:hypothetical protein [Kribbella sp. VKM Ac-2527]
MTERIETKIEEYAPGFTDRITARRVLTSPELERRDATSSAARSTAGPRA